MNKEQLLEKVKTIVKSELYYGNRVVGVGQKLTVKRYEFSPYCLVAIDSKGEALEDQPEKLDTAMVREVLAMSGSTKGKTSYPTLGEDEDKAKADAQNKVIAETAFRKAAEDMKRKEEAGSESALV